MPTDDTTIRLVAGMIEAIESKGYAAVTISDVVRHARLSKRSFYEKFADKEDCFLAAYHATSTELLMAMAAAADAADGWQAAADAALRTYLELLAANPALTRAFLQEISLAGPRALDARRIIHGRFAAQLRAIVADARRENPDVRPLPPRLATALIGGINELVVVALEESSAKPTAKRASDVRALHAIALELLLAVLLREV